MHVGLAARLERRCHLARRRRRGGTSGGGGGGGGRRGQRRDAPVSPGVARHGAEPGDAVGELDARFDPFVLRRGLGGGGGAEVEEQASLVVLG